MQNIPRWLYLSDLDHLVVREWVNGLWFAASLALSVVWGSVLGQRALASWREGYLRQWFFGYDYGPRLATVVLGYFIGETVYRGWIWLLGLSQNLGWESAEFIQQ